MAHKLYIERIDRSRTINITDRKTGQPKTLSLCNIQSGGRWYSSYAGQWNQGWKEGDTIEAEVTEKQSNGRTYWNLRPISAQSQTMDEIKTILTRQGAILERIATQLGLATPSANSAGSVQVVETKMNSSPSNAIPPPGDADVPPFDESDCPF